VPPFSIGVRESLSFSLRRGISRADGALHSVSPLVISFPFLSGALRVCLPQVLALVQPAGSSWFGALYSSVNCIESRPFVSPFRVNSPPLPKLEFLPSADTRRQLKGRRCRHEIFFWPRFSASDVSYFSPGRFPGTQSSPILIPRGLSVLMFPFP